MNKKILILPIIFLSIFLIGIVSAQERISHNVSLVQTTTQTEDFGFNITANSEDFFVTAIEKNSGANGTEALIRFQNGTYLANATFSGDFANFTDVLLKADTSYLIYVGDGSTGTPFSRAFNNTNTLFPRDNSYFNYVGGARGLSTLGDTSFNNIEAVYVDAISININLNSPENNYNSTNQTIIFNGTVFDTTNGIVNVSLIVNGTTLQTNSSGLNGTDYTFNQNIPFGSHTWKFEVCNDQNICIVSDTRTINIEPFFLNSFTFNSSSFETKNETFYINITGNGTTPTNGKLIYAGTSYSATISSIGNNEYNVSRKIQIPLGNTSNNFFFNISIGNSEFSTSTQTQTVSETFFTICNSSYNTPYLNISFKNETTSQEDVNATIISNWEFSLGSLALLNKSYSYSNTTENSNYTFCGSPGTLPFEIDGTLSYENSESPQRTSIINTVLTNSTTELTLYLLPLIKGLFNPFSVVDNVGDSISEVTAQITRTLGGGVINVVQGITDDSGFITFFLNPDVTYTGLFGKTGFNSETFTFIPTTDTRTVVLGGGISGITNGTTILIGTNYSITPKNKTLLNDTSYTFGFSVNSTQDITYIGFNLTDKNGNIFQSQSTSGQGFISGSLDTKNNKTIVGYYTIQTTTESISFTNVWNVDNSFIGDYSFFRQLGLWNDYEFQDPFWQYFIILFVLVSGIWGISKVERVDSMESKIGYAVLIIWIFSSVGWLDTGIIPATGASNLNNLASVANQFGIAIVCTAIGLYYVLRRVL